jgi:acetyl-CoA synthetase
LRAAAEAGDPAQGIVDDALRKVTAGGHEVPTVLVFDHARAAARADVPFVPGRDAWWQDEVAGQPTTCAVEWMGAEEPLFKARC